MKTKTSELIDLALDYAVAKCEVTDPVSEFDYFFTKNHANGFCHYSTDWAQGGPIIEREGITLDQQFRLNSQHDWVARLTWLDEAHGEGFGPTPLIAAMRAFVTSKLGDEIDVPDVLL